MNKKVGRVFWIVSTGVIVVFTVLIVGRNMIHAIKIKRQISALERERQYYQSNIEQDSTLLERLRFDEYLEQYARENYRMQKANEQIYIVK